MKPFGTHLLELATNFAEREADVAFLEQLKREGGAYRLSLNVDHPCPKIRAAADAAFKDPRVAQTAINAMIKLVTEQMEQASAAIQTDSFANSMKATSRGLV